MSLFFYDHRLQGEAYLETSGELSLLPTDAADVVRKKDLPRLKAMVK